MQQHLLTLSYHVENYPCPRVSLVLATHLLDTAVPFIEALGKATDLRAVIGIPYSTRPTAVEALSARYPVSTPTSLSEMREKTLTETDAVLARGGDQPVVLQEIGGYCAGDVAERANSPGFAGVVEDTNQGHWRYVEQSPPLPVLSIAQSPLKALENRQVDRSIAYSLNRLLRTHFYRLASETTIAVVGYGGNWQGIGSAV